MRRACQDYGAGREKRSDPETDGDLADMRNLTVEQRDVENADGNDDENGRRIFPDVPEIIRKDEITRSALQLPDADALPHEEQCHQPPKCRAPETFAQVDV